MRLRLFKILFLLLLTSCVDRTSNNTANTASIPVAENSATALKDTTPNTFDTTLFPFSDSSYKLTLHVFGTNSYNEEKSNSTITFNHFYRDKTERIFQDSFYCMNALLDRRDFNNDKIKDVSFFYFTGARANPTYHLYLVDTIRHKLKYVKGFENLPNPTFDSIHNIISSSALYGQRVATSFYRINSRNKLINLGHSIDTDFGDSVEYGKAINKISKNERK